jgi:ADP-ribose pyrophosphatase
VKKSSAQRHDDTVMESPSLAITSPTTPSPDPEWAPLLSRATAQPSPEGGTFTDGLPQHWSATVRRNRWGTWSATGTYDGPETAHPQQIGSVAGWCWTRSQAIKQVGYWIEDSDAVNRDLELSPTGPKAVWISEQDIEQAMRGVEPAQLHPGDVAAIEPLWQLDWDDAIAEDSYRREHGNAPIEYTDPATFTTGITEGWADVETDPADIDWPVRQAGALIPYEVINGRPVSPGPPASIARGRNQLGRWGENPMADAVITATTWDKPRHILLVERGDGLGWAVPGGAIEPGESPDIACLRELHEETGLLTWPGAWRFTPPRFVPDPRGSDEAWAVTVVGRIDLQQIWELPPVRGGDDARQAQWVPADTYDALVAALAEQHGGSVFPAHIPMLTQILTEPEPEEGSRPR